MGKRVSLEFLTARGPRRFHTHMEALFQGLPPSAHKKDWARTWLAMLQDRHETWALCHTLLSEEAKALSCRKRSRNYACHQGASKDPLVLGKSGSKNSLFLGEKQETPLGPGPCTDRKYRHPSEVMQVRFQTTTIK